MRPPESLQPLHEEDGFILTAEPEWALASSWIFHNCGREPGLRRWTLADCWKGQCSGCRKPIPEGILGLWKLHNFDFIQGH